MLINTLRVGLLNLIWIIEIILFIRAILSWIPGASNNKFGEIIYQITEPILLPFRKLVSHSAVLSNSMIDISFIVAILVLEILKTIID